MRRREIFRMVSAAALLAAAPTSSHARQADADYPRADDREALVAWLGARTNIAAATVVSVTPELVVAIVGKTQPPTPGGPVRLTLREEVIDAAYVDSVGGRSSLMSLEIQCEERRVRMDERRLYADANLGGSVDISEPSSTWVRIPEGSIMDDVARAACDDGYSWPLQSAQVKPQVTGPTVLAAAEPVAPVAAPPAPEPAPAAAPEIPPAPEPEVIVADAGAAAPTPPVAQPAPEIAPPVAPEVSPPPPEPEAVVEDAPAAVPPEVPAPTVLAAAEPAPPPAPEPAPAVEPEVTAAETAPVAPPDVVSPEPAAPEVEPGVPPPAIVEQPTAPAPVPESIPAPAPEPPAPPEIPPVAGGPVFAIQIGAYDTEEMAQAAWQALSANRPVLVEGLRFDIRPVTVKGRYWLRGLVRDFATREAAAAFCTALAGTEYGCILRTLSD